MEKENRKQVAQPEPKPVLGEVRIRGLSDILKEADATTELQVLIKLWNEIADNKYKYPLVQIRFANEHIRELALKSEAPDIEKGKFYMALREMYNVDCVG